MLRAASPVCKLVCRVSGNRDSAADGGDERKIQARGSALNSKERVWLQKAKKALVVPEKLVKNMKEYSHDPDVLRAWRENLANCIDSSNAANVDPWGPNFGVRGFHATPR